MSNAIVVMVIMLCISSVLSSAGGAIYVIQYEPQLLGLEEKKDSKKD
jgi:hypothetical protein